MCQYILFTLNWDFSLHDTEINADAYIYESD